MSKNRKIVAASTKSSGVGFVLPTKTHLVENNYVTY